MHVETSGGVVSSALWRARFRGDAERLDLSDSISADLTGDGSDAALRFGSERGRLVATTNRLHLDEPATGVSLLRAVSRDRLGVGVFCVPAGETRALEFAVVVVFAAVLLPASDVLRDDQVSGDGDPRAGSWLGQTRTQSHSGSRTVILAADFRENLRLINNEQQDTFLVCLRNNSPGCARVSTLRRAAARE